MEQKTLPTKGEIVSAFYPMSVEDKAEVLGCLISRYFNTFSETERFKHLVPHITRDHRTLQQNFFRFILALCRQWATNYKESIYDDRNKAACKYSSEIVAMSEHDNWYVPMI